VALLNGHQHICLNPCQEFKCICLKNAEIFLPGNSTRSSSNYKKLGEPIFKTKTLCWVQKCFKNTLKNLLKVDKVKDYALF